MTKKTRTKIPGAAKLALVTLMMAGGVTIGLMKNDPNVAVAQASAPAAGEMVLAQSAPRVTLHKDPSCTCCGKWGDHLRENGFEVSEEVHDNVHALMDERGIPNHLRSCHFGVVGDYVLVGHVPADLAARLLEEKPVAAGIAVPGMPLGSPGMEHLGRKDRYDVIAFGPDGAEYVYETR